jgi:V(D)J recombination-activating protein 1
VCIVPIELEREALKGKIIDICVEGGVKRRHTIMFFSSMEDEKSDRAFSGLQGSGSSYICTLCTATSQSAREQCGTFTVNRSEEQATALGEYVRSNPDNLNTSQMSMVAKGVKSLPVLKSQPMERMLDATHADINMSSFLKKLLVRLIAGVLKWDATQDIKQKLVHAEVLFDQYIKRHIGSNPQLMMPGNYGRMLFAEENAAVITALITDDSARQQLQAILGKYREMRLVYRANIPDPVKVSGYKKLAVSFANDIKEHFPFAKWPNYMHKVVEHVQELIEWKAGPGSIGALSSEGWQ